jgi:hypothetical protein
VAASWLFGSLVAGAAAYRGFRRLGATRMEAAVAAYAAALLGPTLCTVWFWMLPLGRVAGPVLGALTSGAVSTVALRRWGWSWCDLAVRRRTALFGAPVLLVTAWLLGTSVLAALDKPVDEWDSLMYHGPAAANALAHGSLFGWHSPVGWVYYPDLAAIQGAVTAVVVGSTDLLDAVQVPFAGLLVLVMWAWASDGRTRILPGSLAVGVIALPVVFPQLRAMSIDVVFASTGLFGLWCLALWWKRGRAAGYLAAGAAGLGAMAASKPSGLGLLVIALGLLGLWLVVRRPAGAVRTAAVAAAAVWVGAAPFYLRNLIEFGNPLYPISVGAGPITLPGLVGVDAFRVDNPAFADTPGPLQFFQSLWMSMTDPPNGITHDVRAGGFGRPVVVFALAALLALLFVAIAPVRRRLVAGVLPILVPAVAFLLVQPQSWYPRYSILPFALLVVAAALVLGRALRPLAVVLPLSVGLLIAWPLVAADSDRRMWHGRDNLARLAAESPAWNTGVDGYASAYHDAYRFLDGAPCGTRITVVANHEHNGLYSQFNLPLWGEGLCNDVRVIRLEPGRDLTAAAVQAELRRALETADYVVVPQEADALVARLAPSRNRTVARVGVSKDFFGFTEHAFRLGSATPGAGAG